MTDTVTPSHYLQRQAKSAAPKFPIKSVKPKPNQVLVNEYCPIHGTPKCICTDDENENNNNNTSDNDDAGNDDGAGQSLTNNHCYSNGWNDGEAGRLQSLLMYRDALRRNLTTPVLSGEGLPKMRCGRIGSSWRHIKQTNTYSGSNLLFIDGTVRVDDSFKFPMNRFGYPPKMKRHYSMNYLNNSPLRSSSFNDGMTKSMNNFNVKSMNNLTWSATEELNKRPSLSQYNNRYSRHAKDGFTYWPTDVVYKKPKAQQCCTGTYKTWLGLSDAVLKL